jgi:hypothetical protein
VRTDYYRLLHVDPSAPPAVIKAAYRALLAVVGKHPDRGGDAAETRDIIEAYRTLIDPDRRRVYDRWVKAHAARPAAVALPPGAVGWIRSALAGWEPAAGAPFAPHFDLVLRPRRLLPGLLYVKAGSLASRRAWPTLFTLWRAVRLARSGSWPYRDVVLVVAGESDLLPVFLQESARPRTRTSLNRCDLVVCTFPPPAIHLGAPSPPAAAVVRRLQAAC